MEEAASEWELYKHLAETLVKDLPLRRLHASLAADLEYSGSGPRFCRRAPLKMTHRYDSYLQIASEVLCGIEKPRLR